MERSYILDYMMGIAMTKHKIIIINILVLVCLLFTRQASADSGYFNWSEDTSHLSRDYNSVAYGKGLFVAAGEKGLISVSKDLKQWDNIFIKPDDLTEFNTVLFNGEVFVAAGSRTICWSKDGYHWNNVETEEISYTSGKLVISLDESILYGAVKGKTFVLSGNGFLAYSSDGVNWIKHPNAHLGHSAAGAVGLLFSNVVYDGSQFVTVCERLNEDAGGCKYFVYTSIDGKSWNIKEFKIDKQHKFKRLCFYGNKYYITAYDYDVKKDITYQSENLTDWEKTEKSIDNILIQLNDCTYKLGDGIYSLKSGEEEFINEYKAADTEKINGICSGNGKTVAVGTNGLIVFKDKDDKAWSTSTTLCFKDIYSAASNGTLMVAVGKDGQIIKSTDGSNWSMVKTDINNSLHSVIYDGKSFIAVGDNGTIATSTDGTSWIQSPKKTAKDIFIVKKLNNQYIAAGKGATILISKDLKSWNLVHGVEKDKLTFDEPFSGITWNNGVYYAITNINSFVYTSNDGTNWKQTSRLRGNAYTDLTYHMGRFVLIGGDMSISQDMKTDTVIKNGYFPYEQTEFIKLSTFKDFLLAGTPDGNILFSSDGAQWQNQGNLSTSDGINSIVEFKGKFYGFGNNGVLICGIQKNIASKQSDITVSAFYDFFNPDLSAPQYQSLNKQPIFKDNTILLSLDTISKIIGSDFSYDKKKKTAVISVGKKNIKFTQNTLSVLVNGKKTTMPQKIQVSGNSVFVPAEFTLNSLGYIFSYDSFKRRIFITVNDNAQNKSLTYKPVTFKNNDGSLYFQSICYNQTIYVAAATDGIVCTSKDGENWSRTAAINGDFSKVIWNGKRFILFGGTTSDLSNAKALIYTSEDGLKWTKVEKAPTGKYLYDAAVDSSKNILNNTVAVAADGTVFSSKDGLEWKQTFSPKEQSFSNICWYKGMYYLACRDIGKVYCSKDGTKGSSYNTKLSINKLISSGGYLWAVSQYGMNSASCKLYRSSDGKNWSYINDMPNKYINDIAYTGKSFILIGYRSSSNSPTAPLGFTMLSHDTDIWELCSVPAGFEFPNNILITKNKTLLATSKGLFIIK